MFIALSHPPNLPSPARAARAPNIRGGQNPLPSGGGPESLEARANPERHRNIGPSQWRQLGLFVSLWAGCATRARTLVKGILVVSQNASSTTLAALLAGWRCTAYEADLNSAVPVWLNNQDAGTDPQRQSLVCSTNALEKARTRW